MIGEKTVLINANTAPSFFAGLGGYLVTFWVPLTGPTWGRKTAGHRIPGHVLLLLAGAHFVFHYPSVQYP